VAKLTEEEQAAIDAATEKTKEKVPLWEKAILQRLANNYLKGV
jgi:hypothetical protein